MESIKFPNASFRKKVSPEADNLNSVLYKPQNQRECDETVKLILQHG